MNTSLEIKNTFISVPVESSPKRRTLSDSSVASLGSNFKLYSAPSFGSFQSLFDQDFDSLINDRFVLGSPEDCYEQLRPYWEEFGVSHLMIRTHWAGMPLSTSLHSLRMISNELLPGLKSV